MSNTAAAAAVILAGGMSTRFGRDKASELLVGRTLLQRVIDRFDGLVDEYVVVCARGQALPSVDAPGGVNPVEDAYPGTGPLGGIYTGLSAMRASHAVVVACDMPLLQPTLIAELLHLASQHDLVVPLNEAGLPEPLCTAYSKAFIEAAKRHLDAGAYKISDVFDELAPKYLQPEEWRAFDRDGVSLLNVNRKEDLQRAIALLEEEEGA